MKTITREELKAKMDRGDAFVLLEALGEASYRRGHLPGAIRLQDTSAAAEVVPDEEAFIVAYCSNFNWHSSTRVVRELTAMGYENAYEYEGGKEDWIEAGYPVGSEVPWTRRTLLDEYADGIVPVRWRLPRSFQRGSLRKLLPSRKPGPSFRELSLDLETPIFAVGFAIGAALLLKNIRLEEVRPVEPEQRGAPANDTAFVPDLAVALRRDAKGSGDEAYATLLDSIGAAIALSGLADRIESSSGRYPNLLRAAAVLANGRGGDEHESAVSASKNIIRPLPESIRK